MNYIILDLEWNGAYSNPLGRYINEIIEFGAVKLDENLREIDSFQVFIKSQLTKRLCARFQTLTNITNEDMGGGVSFKSAVSLYSDWAGTDSLTLTWSDTDIHVLLDNCRSFLNMKTIPFIEKYADLQKYIQRRLEISGNQISLSAAAELMQIDLSKFETHRALGDSRICAELLRQAFDFSRLSEYIWDTRAADYYARLTFKSYAISDLSSPEIDRSELRFRCENCGKFARRISDWQFRSKTFRADFKCRNCGNSFVGRLRFIRNFDGVRIKRNVFPIAENAAEKQTTEALMEKE